MASSRFQYRPSRSPWGKVKRVQCPQTIFEEDFLLLTGTSIKLLMVLLDIEKARRSARTSTGPVVTVKVSESRLMERMGSSRTTVDVAIKDLEDKGFLLVQRKNRTKGKRIASNQYVMMNRETGNELVRKPGENPLWGANGVLYFEVPASFLSGKNIEAANSISRLSSSATAIYTTLLYRAGQCGRLSFEIAWSELTRLSRIKATRTAVKAMTELMDVGLVWSETIGRKLTVELLDPSTGSSVYVPHGDDEDDPTNYRAVDGDHVSRGPLSRQGTPEQHRSLVRALFRDDGPVSFDSDGSAMVRCCFRAENTPSLSIGTAPFCRYFCFGCKAHGGDISEIVMAVRGCSRPEAMEIVAEAFGLTLQFVQSIPPKAGEVRFYYKDKSGKILKLVRRFPNPVTGKKDFDQWKPVPGGWVPNIRGVKACLYNTDRLIEANIVAIVEGEQDADAVTNLGLVDGQGLRFIGVTSGNSDSWDPSFAKVLRGKRVVLLPDADEPGQRYAAAVVASLEANGIEYVQVSFAGTNCNDVTDYINAHGEEALLRHMNCDWIHRAEDHRKALIEADEVFQI